MRVASKVGNLRSEFGLRVLQLFAMYATDGQTKPTLTAPFPTGGGIISENVFNIMTQHDDVIFSTDIYNQNLSNQ